MLDRLPLELLKRYEKWKDIVRISGRAGLRPIKGLNDERLHGEWGGHRSTSSETRAGFSSQVCRK